MPSLARFRGPGDGTGWFVITHPAGRAQRREVPAPTGRLRSAVIGLVSFAAVLGCALWAASQAGSLLGALLLLVLGGSVGALVGGMLAVALGSLPSPGLRLARRRSDDDGRRRVVRPSDERAWRLCEIGAALAATTSWSDRTVDRDRRVPAILWSAVQRSLVVDRQFQDAQRAAAHASLADLAQDTLTRLAEERASLDAIEANLRAVLAAAGGIDQRRAQLALDRERRREERELRTRLTGQQASLADPLESHLQADRSAGVAAEAEVVAELLAESDAMLRDLD
jgi:hypothetical protein